jgi:hypothetical protein
VLPAGNDERRQLRDTRCALTAPRWAPAGLSVAPGLAMGTTPAYQEISTMAFTRKSDAPSAVQPTALSIEDLAAAAGGMPSGRTSPRPASDNPSSTSQPSVPQIYINDKPNTPWAQWEGQYSTGSNGQTRYDGPSGTWNFR